MRPTFIACCARSGSTLLRWMLDAHPQVSCPSESDLALAVASLQRSDEALWGPDTPVVRARQAVEGVIEQHLRQSGKKVYCDKSMSNALNLDLLAKAWLGAHFVFLHRHVMDFISSALDAQPWGLTDYGFSAYAAMYPGDNVAALARYWLERTGRMLNFESKTGHRTVRIRYEDLVASPGDTMAPVWPLLGVEAPENDPDEALSSPHDAHGHADHLIWYTRRISTSSVGTGARIPVGRITGMLRMEVNALLAELNYDPIDDAWGAGGPLVEGVVRIVRHHEVLAETQSDLPGTTVVEHTVAPLLAAGHVNAGMAMRSQDIRHYGRPWAGYQEERSVVGRLSPILKEMV